MQVGTGKSILNGIAIGKLKIYKKKDTVISTAQVADTAAEEARFEEARAKAIDQQTALYEKALAEAGMPRTQVHAEVFNSLAGDPFRDVEVAEVSDEEAADAATVEVELDGETHTLVWPRKQTLVDIMLAKGLDVPYSCQEGECGSCACTVTEGEVQMDNSEILDAEDVANGYILGCQAKPITDHLKIEF